MPVDVEVGAHPVHSHPDVMGQVAKGEQIVGVVKRHPLVETQPFARQDFPSDGEKGGVIDLEVLRKHTQVMILTGRGRICNWCGWQFCCHSKSGNKIAQDTHQTRMNIDGGLTRGLSLCFRLGHKERILLARQNFF
jgi:hypothetical protein